LAPPGGAILYQALAEINNLHQEGAEKRGGIGVIDPYSDAAE